MSFIKKVKKTGKKVGKTAKKTGKKAGKTAEKTVKKTGKAVDKTTKDVVDVTTDIVEDAADWAVDAGTSLSRKAGRLADECVKALDKIGNLAQALLDEIFLAALEAFVDQILKDYVNAVDSAVKATKAFAKNPRSALELIEVIQKLAESPTDAGKVAFVNATRFSNTPGYVAAVKALGFKAVTVGVQADAGGSGGSSGVAADSSELTQAYAGSKNATKVDMAWYAGLGIARGTASAGASTGVELGAWRDKPRDLAGGFLGVSIGASYEGGVEVEVYVSKDLRKFLGFNVVPQTGSGVEFNVIEGKTKVLMTF